MVSFEQVRGRAPITVPGDAVIVRNDQTSVATVVNGDKVHVVPVRIGRDYGPSVEIVSGLEVGNTVITSVTDGVREGATVHPQQKATAGEQGSKPVAPQTSTVDIRPGAARNFVMRLP